MLVGEYYIRRPQKKIAGAPDKRIRILFIFYNINIHQMWKALDKQSRKGKPLTKKQKAQLLVPKYISGTENRISNLHAEKEVIIGQNLDENLTPQQETRLQKIQFEIGFYDDLRTKLVHIRDVTFEWDDSITLFP
jgi:hypothetical protein